MVNNLLPEVIQDQWFDETKMKQVLRTLRSFICPEMLDNKGL
jgi:hypothetical protein